MQHHRERDADTYADVTFPLVHTGAKGKAIGCLGVDGNVAVPAAICALHVSTDAEKSPNPCGPESPGLPEYGREQQLQ